MDQIENVLFGTVQISVKLDRVPESHTKALRFWLDFMKRENYLLTQVPIYADAPQMLYPLVNAIDNGRGIIADYLSGYIVRLPASKLAECYIINANSGSTLVIDADESAIWNIEVMNPMGEVVRTESKELNGISTISVPAYGLIHMMRA